MKRREMLSVVAAGVAGAFSFRDTNGADRIIRHNADISEYPLVPQDLAKELADLLDSLLSSNDRSDLYPEFCQEVSRSEMNEISHTHKFHSNFISIDIDDGTASNMLEKWAAEIAAPLLWKEIQSVSQLFLMDALSIRNISIFNSEQDCRQYHSDRGDTDLVALNGKSFNGYKESESEWIYMVKRELRPRMTILGPVIRGHRHKSGSKIVLRWSIGVAVESGLGMQRRIDAVPAIPMVGAFELHQLNT